MHNSGFASFDDLVAAFLAEQAAVVDCACVAGPVIDQAVTMTNLAWSLDAGQLVSRHGLRRVWLINDLVATALGAVQLGPADLYPLTGTPGRARSWPCSRPAAAWARPSSCRRGRLAAVPVRGRPRRRPRNREQLDLLAHLLALQDHVAVEQVCSGLAIPELFDFWPTASLRPPGCWMNWPRPLTGHR